TTIPLLHDSPLLGDHTPGSDESSKKLNELTDLCTKLSDKVTSLEEDLKETKKVYGKALTKLVTKVKHLEDKLKPTKARRKSRLVISNDEEDLLSEDTSKKGRMTETTYEGAKDVIDLGVLSAAKILTDASSKKVKTYTRRRRSIDSSRVSTIEGLFSTAEELQAKEEQERADFEKALELQRQVDERKEAEDIDWNTIVEQVQEKQSDTIKVSNIQEETSLSSSSKKEYDDIFKEYGWIQDEKDIEVEKTKTKRIAEETLLQESFKKLRTAEASRSKSVQEEQIEEPRVLSEEELKGMMVIVPEEGINVEALQTKYPIIDWEVSSEGNIKKWKIIRVGNHIELYQCFEDMLENFDKEDLEKLWSLVKEKFSTTEPTDDKEKALWV
ncbi:hypothetical protein Tco_1157698, partial [Tanacetum coccineum]